MTLDFAKVKAELDQYLRAVADNDEAIRTLELSSKVDSRSLMEHGLNRIETTSTAVRRVHFGWDDRTDKLRP